MLTTSHAMLTDFEQRYGDSIPTVRGDFTPYWEDGAASSARETAINRAAAERLVQAETLWAVLRPKAFPAGEFDAAWRNVVLFDEHTWGSWNSISEPNSPFTKQQWDRKRRFVLDAQQQSRELLNIATKDLAPANETVDRFAVFNTSSWVRSDLVSIPTTWRRSGDRVTDADGRPVPSQRLRNGELAVWVEDLPPLAAAVYCLSPGQPHDGPEVRVSESQLANDRVSLKIDPQTGLISSLRDHATDAELVDQDAARGLGDYLYVAGRRPDRPQRSTLRKLEVVERGPLVAAVRAIAEAPGCDGLSNEVRLTATADHVDLIAGIDKQEVYDPEAVYFAFPFAIPRPEVRFDLAWSIARPEVDQLPGACRNYFTAQRWVDVSNEARGITLATIDAPLIEIGGLMTDATVVGWRERAEDDSLLYSYVMNNYWETNYLAAQPGPATIRYALRPHGRFDATSAKRFGIERSQPLIVAPVDEGHVPASEPLVHIAPAEVIVSRVRPSRDGRALILRLFNASGQTQRATLKWPQERCRGTWLGSPCGERRSPATFPIEVPAWGIVTLHCELDDSPS
jgi:alpha-mannosidase